MGLLKNHHKPWRLGKRKKDWLESLNEIYKWGSRWRWVVNTYLLVSLQVVVFIILLCVRSDFSWKRKGSSIFVFLGAADVDAIRHCSHIHQLWLCFPSKIFLIFKSIKYLFNFSQTPSSQNRFFSSFFYFTTSYICGLGLLICLMGRPRPARRWDGSGGSSPWSGVLMFLGLGLYTCIYKKNINLYKPNINLIFNKY